jgi:RNA polymerase sigma-70 factor (ECF subfamily)
MNAQTMETANPWGAAEHDGIARRHGDLLYRMAFHFTGNRPDALDLVQDTYEASLRKLPVALPRDRVAYWLATTLRNRFIDQTRSFERRMRLSEPLDETISPLPAQEQAEHQPSWVEIDSEELWQAADRLKPLLREVFLLRAQNGKAYSEIAVRLGIPSSTVGTRYYRALKCLRKLLEVSHNRASCGKNRGPGTS